MNDLQKSFRPLEEVCYSIYQNPFQKYRISGIVLFLGTSLSGDSKIIRSFCSPVNFAIGYILLRKWFRATAKAESDAVSVRNVHLPREKNWIRIPSPFSSL